MQQLTGLDAAFLALETKNSTGHVGGVCILDPTDAPKPLDLARLTELLAQRLPLVPVMRCKLLEVPLGLDQPYWVDDPDFDIEYHIREIALPGRGTEAQLAEQVSRLHARPLDRSRPMWEIYLITGLAKKRIAVYSKVHHSAIDGASGAELLTILLDLSPEGRGETGLAARGHDKTCRRTRPGRTDAGAGRRGHRRRNVRPPPRRWQCHFVKPRPRTDDSIQQADHPAPPGGFPQCRTRRRQTGQECLRRFGQRRCHGNVCRRAAPVAR